MEIKEIVCIAVIPFAMGIMFAVLYALLIIWCKEK